MCTYSVRYERSLVLQLPAYTYSTHPPQLLCIKNRNGSHYCLCGKHRVMEIIRLTSYRYSTGTPSLRIQTSSGNQPSFPARRPTLIVRKKISDSPQRENDHDWSANVDLWIWDDTAALA
jgi:hypothetical protein